MSKLLHQYFQCNFKDGSKSHPDNRIFIGNTSILLLRNFEKKKLLYYNINAIISINKS